MNDRTKDTIMLIIAVLALLWLAWLSCPGYSQVDVESTLPAWTTPIVEAVRIDPSFVQTSLTAFASDAATGAVPLLDAQGTTLSLEQAATVGASIATIFGSERPPRRFDQVTAYAESLFAILEGPVAELFPQQQRLAAIEYLLSDSKVLLANESARLQDLSDAEHSVSLQP